MKSCVVCVNGLARGLLGSFGTSQNLYDEYGVMSRSSRSSLSCASLRARLTAWVVAIALATASFAACGKEAPPPPVDDSMRQGTNAPAAKSQGMSTGKKVVLLAGAAALYYLYKKHQNAGKEGPEGQYYLSKNGRVYYRDAEHRAHWVTPPPEGIQVPAHEAAQYEQFQGYENRSTGHDLSGLAAD